MLDFGAKRVGDIGTLLGWLSTPGARVLEHFDERLEDAWEPFLSDDADARPFI